MKKVILIIGTIFLLFNTLTGLIVSGYHSFNFLMADFSILLTIAAVWFVAYTDISSALKIGLSFIFIITGLIRMICMIIMPSAWENNFVILIVAGILLFEIICIMVSKYINKK